MGILARRAPPLFLLLTWPLHYCIFRTVVKQFGEYLATDPFHTLGIPTIPLEHDHGEFFVLDQVIDGLEIHQLDHLVADFFRKYKMGGVHGESEVKVTTLECRFEKILFLDFKNLRIQMVRA